MNVGTSIKGERKGNADLAAGRSAGRGGGSTGGNGSDALQSLPSPTPDRAFTNAWGVCKLTLNANDAQVDFLPAPGSPGTDSATVAVRP